MVPNFTLGVIDQRLWRAVGDIDDCVVCADINCVHSIAAWETLPSSVAYRLAAGNPDDPKNPDGLSIDQSVKAIHQLWPKLDIEAIKGGSWAPFIEKVKAGHPASLCVYDPSLATSGGKVVRHRGSLYWNGSILRFVNPLRKAFSIGTEVEESFIKSAAIAYPDPGDVYAILFPTVEEAFKTHPLYPSIDTKAAYNEGVTAGAKAALTAVKP